MSSEIRKILKKYGIRPSKRLGQNFLIDKRVLNKIVATAELKPDDIVLEVGPGIGNLTIELAKRVKKVIAVEKDPKMVEILKETLKDSKNVEIIQGDILKFQIPNSKFQTNSKSKITNYKLVANLPYYIVSPTIRKFLEIDEVKPRQLVLMVQKEVAQRICASPPHLIRCGGKAPKMNLLAVSVQFYAKPKIIAYVSKKSFRPQPKVDSAIIRITPRQPAPYRDEVSGAGFRERFFRVVKAGFSHPRKQLLNNLAEGLALSLPKGLKLNKTEIIGWLLKNNIQPSQRAETLAIDDWLNLTKSIKIE